MIENNQSNREAHDSSLIAIRKALIGAKTDVDRIGHNGNHADLNGMLGPLVVGLSNEYSSQRQLGHFGGSMKDRKQ